MIIPGFAFSTFLMIMERPEKFTSIKRDHCKIIMESYPNGMNGRQVDEKFATEDMGNVFYKRDSMVFMMDVKEEENEIILKHLVSNEYEINRFCTTYFDVKKRVEEIGGTFIDERTKK